LTTPRVLRPIRDGWVIKSDERDAYGRGEILAVPPRSTGRGDAQPMITTIHASRITRPILHVRRRRLWAIPMRQAAPRREIGRARS
jgi:hypothetical protein